MTPYRVGFDAIPCDVLATGNVYIEECSKQMISNSERLLLFRKNADRPFLTVADFLIEANMQAWLALTDLNKPDNVYYSPRIYDTIKTAGEPNFVVSNSNRSSNPSTNEAEMIINFDNLKADSENDFKVSAEGIKNNAQFFLVTGDNEIIYSARSGLLTAVPDGIPTNVIHFGGKSSNGNNNPELNKLTIKIKHEKEFGWYAIGLPYNLLTLLQ